MSYGVFSLIAVKCQQAFILCLILTYPLSIWAKDDPPQKLLAYRGTATLPTEIEQKPLSGKEAADTYIKSTYKANATESSQYDKKHKAPTMSIDFNYFISSAINDEGSLLFKGQGLALRASYLKEILSQFNIFFRGDLGFQKTRKGPVHLFLQPFFVWRLFPVYLGLSGLSLEFFSDLSDQRKKAFFAMSWQVLAGIQIPLFDRVILFTEVKWQNPLHIFNEVPDQYNQSTMDSISLLIGTSLLF